VKDIRKLIGKMIWVAREEEVYLEEKLSARHLLAEESSVEEVVLVQ
jgi:hypothetical protein